MNQNTKITVELNERSGEIQNHLDSGLCVAEVAKKMGFGYAAVYNAVKRNGLSVKVTWSKTAQKGRSKRAKVTATKDELYDLYWNKESDLYEIAAVYDTTASAILYYFRKYDIPRRSKSDAMNLAHMKDPDLRDRFRQLVYDGHTGYPSIRGRESWIEAACREWLEENNIHYDQEYQINGDGHFYDFRVGRYLIEMDGVYWHSKPEQMEKDRRFENIAMENGFEVIRITDKEVKFDPSVFDERLKNVR